MPGFLLHQGAVVACAHGGQGQPSVVNPRVQVGGQPTVTIAAPYLVSGCPLPAPPNGNGPCVSAQFTSAATRLTSNGQPLLLIDSHGTCAPTGTPLTIIAAQTRVTGV